MKTGKRAREEPTALASASLVQSSAAKPTKRRRLLGEQDIIHDLYANPVTIFVGPDAYPFHLYKEVLCRDAEFFKTAFNGSFQEGNDQTISLPEDDIQIFRIYQNWLNTGKLRYNFDEEECWLHLGKLWIFADKIRSPQLKDKTVETIIQLVTENSEMPFAEPETVRYVFSKTMPRSELRGLFNRLFLYLCHTITDDNMDLYPQEFLATILKWTLTKIKHSYFTSLPDSVRFHGTSDPSLKR